MAELALNNIFINYFGARDVIHSFTHTFTGGLNVIYGAEGSGKTTLLKAIAGLVHIKEGSIQLDGKEYSEVRIREKGIAMVFDDLALRNRRCVRYNLELPLRLRKFAPEIIRERVGAVSAEFGLSSGIMDVAVFRLSEEYKVRIALARAFMRESKILIFDNPFARLSPDIREELFLLLLGHIRKSETVVIYATD
ncbi:MAG: ABC transporter ATP-binding protein, partial [Clostridia bacterium]|nr:ABC transporter ATP-binding protein [Clostridia bacterium]